MGGDEHLDLVVIKYLVTLPIRKKGFPPTAGASVPGNRPTSGGTGCAYR